PMPARSTTCRVAARGATPRSIARAPTCRVCRRRRLIFESPMSDIAPELRALLEKQAIKELVQTYSRAVDRHDFALLRSLYTEDGIDDHGGIYSGSADGFVTWLREAMKHVETSHALHNLTIAIDGDTAEGEAYVTAYNRIPRAEG